MRNEGSEVAPSITEEFSLQDRVIVALRRINRSIDLHSRGLLHQFGLTGPQLAALREIGRLQRTAVGALARMIHVSQATLTGIITRLEKQGYITRTRSDDDRRSVVVELTEKGQEIVKTAPSILQERFRNELMKLTEWEQTQMLATLQRIASMMDAAQIEPDAVFGPVDPPADEIEALNSTSLDDEELADSPDVDAGASSRSEPKSTAAAPKSRKNLRTDYSA